MISIEVSYDLLVTTLSRFDRKNLSLDNSDLAYLIFEELDSEYHSFLHKWTFDRLINRGRIPAVLRHRLFQLRKDIFLVMETKHKVDLYRNDPAWINIREEANSLLIEIKTLNSNG